MPAGKLTLRFRPVLQKLVKRLDTTRVGVFDLTDKRTIHSIVSDSTAIFADRGANVAPFDATRLHSMMKKVLKRHRGAGSILHLHRQYKEKCKKQRPRNGPETRIAASPDRGHDG